MNGNPMQMVMQMLMSGNNPQQLANQLMQSNPQMNAIANQMKNSGMSLTEFLQQYAKQNGQNIQPILNMLSQGELTLSSNLTLVSAFQVLCRLRMADV